MIALSTVPEVHFWTLYCFDESHASLLSTSRLQKQHQKVYQQLQFLHPHKKVGYHASKCTDCHAVLKHSMLFQHQLSWQSCLMRFSVASLTMCCDQILANVSESTNHVMQGKEDDTLWTSVELMAVSEDYTSACSAAIAAVEACLQKLCEDLQVMRHA